VLDSVLDPDPNPDPDAIRSVGPYQDFFQYLAIETRIRINIQPKMLDPDPALESGNTDPKHYC
jgi:hypothetical protein